MPPFDEVPGAEVGERVPQGLTPYTSAPGQPIGAAPVSEPLGEAEANPPMPQGQEVCTDASPSPFPSAALGNPAPEAVAKVALLQGQSLDASASGPQPPSATARNVLPQGQTSHAAALGDLCGQLMSLQRDRRFAIRQQVRCDNATSAYVRTRLGFNPDLDEATRKRLRTRATALKRAIEAGKPLPEEPPTGVTPVVLNGVRSRAVWDEMREEVEKEMVRLAARTPGAGFVARTPGLSLKGLAVIVGEAGDLSDYPKKGHLHSRLGLAVRDGVRQGALPKGLTPAERTEMWKERAYNPARRAEVYAFLDDAFFRAQRAGTYYRDYYDKKKAEYLEREWTKAHADAAARRAMSKVLVRDLWKAWRAEVTGEVG